MAQSDKRYLRELGKSIRLSRKAKQMTQEKLAEAADLNPVHISRIEKGEVDMKLTTYRKLDKVLSLS